MRASDAARHIVDNACIRTAFADGLKDRRIARLEDALRLVIAARTVEESERAKRIAISLL